MAYNWMNDVFSRMKEKKGTGKFLFPGYFDLRCLRNSLANTDFSARGNIPSLADLIFSTV